MSAVGREDLRKGWCPGALRPMMARDGLLVRLRITGGIVPAATALAVADLADRHGNGRFDLSARANLQLRGVREESVPALLAGLDALRLLDGDAGAEAVRNVLASPLAGLGRRSPSGHRKEGPREAWPPSPPSSAVSHPWLAGEDTPDIRPLVAALEHALVADRGLHALPSKFGILVDDGGAPSLAGIAADIRFDWIASEGAFVVGLGGTAADALALGFVAPEAMIDRAIALMRRLLARPGEPRRVGALTREIGRATTAAWFGARVPAFEPAPANPQVVGLRVFAGLSTLGLAVPFGRLDTAMLRAAARFAAGTGTGELRLTPWRTILVPQVAPECVFGTLAAVGFIVDDADPRLRVAACTGRVGCERGTTDTHADAAALASSAAALPGRDVALHVSGCAKGCARPARAAVTLVGRDGRYDLVQDGRASDEPKITGLDLAAVRAELPDIEENACTPARRKRGTMRSMAKRAPAASMHPAMPVSSTKTEDSRLSPLPGAVSSPRVVGETLRCET